MRKEEKMEDANPRTKGDSTFISTTTTTTAIVIIIIKKNKRIKAAEAGWSSLREKSDLERKNFWFDFGAIYASTRSSRKIASFDHYLGTNGPSYATIILEISIPTINTTKLSLNLIVPL